MTDEELVAKKLAFVETCLRELRSLGQPDRIATDVKERRFVEHTLQICIQAALDVAAHIASDERLGEPGSNAALFDLLVPAGWLSADTAALLRAAVGLRNVLVRGYTEVNVDVVRTVLEQRLSDLDRFVEEIRRRMHGQ